MSIGTVPSLANWKRWIPSPPVRAAWGVLLAVFIWNYWTTMVHVVTVWAGTPDYGHGFVVPLFAAFLLWHRQEMVDPWPDRGSLWCIPFFVAFALFRWLNLYLHYERDIDSLFPFLLGMTLALGGWKALRWAWPAILFLIFMVPLPAFLAETMSHILQRVATIMSVYTLQTLGVPAIVSGDQSNVIQLSNPPPLGVAEACSGLRMMTVFYAICIGACFVLREPLWKKIILVISAAPIAVISNVARISVAGMMQEWVSVGAGHVFHDWFGVLMVVPAILLIWGELALLSALLIEPVTEGPLVFGDGEGVLRRRKNPPTPAPAGTAGGPMPRPGVPGAPDRQRQPPLS